MSRYQFIEQVATTEPVQVRYTYFNLDRRHSALGYRSPHQFEHDFQLSLP
ncbi:MAG: hypothetical protein ACRYFR_03665 [Janthinobacterium lividum]